MKNDNEIAQVFEVPVNGGDIREVTQLPGGVQGQFNVSPDGTLLAVIADNSVWIVEVRTGKSVRITPKTRDETAPVLAAVWNKAGNTIVYNRYVYGGTDAFLQIFKVKVN